MNRDLTTDLLKARLLLHEVWKRLDAEDLDSYRSLWRSVCGTLDAAMQIDAIARAIKGED